MRGNARSALESFWVQDDEAKRGELCEVCTCVASAANCTNRDLKTVPFGSDAITSLDLCENPQLVLIGPGAFEGLDSLEVLILPGGIAHGDRRRKWRFESHGNIYSPY